MKRDVDGVARAGVSGASHDALSGVRDDREAAFQRVDGIVRLEETRALLIQEYQMRNA